MSNHNGWLARDNIAALERVEVVRITPTVPDHRTAAMAYEDALNAADCRHQEYLRAEQKYVEAKAELLRAKAVFEKETSGRMTRHVRH